MQKIIKKDDGSVVYIRPGFKLDPYFYFPVLPHEQDRFAMLIVTDHNDNELKNLLKLLINSHINPHIITADSIYQAKKLFTDFNKSNDDLKAQLGIFDLTKDNKFSNVHPSIIPAYADNNADKLYIKNILIPNVLLHDGSDNWNKNYSHTIWITSSIEDIPRIIVTNSQYCFAIGAHNVNKLLKYKLKTAQDVNFPEDNILVICSSLVIDTKLMMLTRSRLK